MLNFTLGIKLNISNMMMVLILHCFQELLITIEKINLIHFLLDSLYCMFSRRFEDSVLIYFLCLYYLNICKLHLIYFQYFILLLVLLIYFPFNLFTQKILHSSHLNHSFRTYIINNSIRTRLNVICCTTSLVCCVCCL